MTRNPPPPASADPPATHSQRLGDFAGLVRIVKSTSPATARTLDGRRKLLADLCKLLGGQPFFPHASPPPPHSSTPATSPVTTTVHLAPRTRQVLDALLQGKSEKEVAASLQISVHTVHVHVKSIYKKANVSSRPELLARWLGPTTLRH